MPITLDIYKGKQIAVMGLGRSGIATVRALIDGGVKVFAWDDNEDSRNKAEALGAEINELSNTNTLKLMEALILSPGIPHTHPAPHPIAQAAKDAGIPIIGDIELLYKSAPTANYIGITGTNGKSTTTALIGHILKDAGSKVEVGGNLGFPVLDLNPLTTDGSYVLEMSSYQLELLDSQKFNIALLLNITNDHLERHGGVEGYIAAKMNIFARQTVNDIAIIAVDDDRTAGIAEALTNGPARVVVVSATQEISGGVYIKDGHIIDDLDGNAVDVFQMSFATTLPGIHNAQNAVAAYAVCKLSGLDTKVIIDALSDFPGLAHRQQMIAIIDDIAFVNDSKATNAEATARALACYGNIYWIAGGVEKDGGYADLRPYMQNISHAFLIGKAANNMAVAFDGFLTTTISDNLSTAINQANGMAKADGKRGSVVLLSPACASFDQFKDFEARGDAFIKFVKALPGVKHKFFVEEAA